MKGLERVLQCPESALIVPFLRDSGELSIGALRMVETNSVEDVTRTLASYVVEAKFEAIPADIKANALKALVNWVGCAVGGSGH